MTSRKSTIILLFILFCFTISSMAEDIHEAAKTGDLVRLKKILSENPSLVNSLDKDKMTPLHHAIDAGNLEAASLLISHGADVNAQHIFLRTPLHNASWGNDDIAKLLITQGANVYLKSNTGEAPIFNYIYMGNKIMCEFLINHGMNINIRTNRGETPLHRSAANGNNKLVELFVSHGSNVNAQTNYNFTPLHFAAIFGHAEIVEILIDHGAYLNMKSNDGGTPLHFAESAEQKGISQLLIEKGASIIPREYPELAGAYFGLKKPGTTPELFAPDILFNISSSTSFTFSDDLKEIYFVLSSQHFTNARIWTMKQKNGKWQPPKRASFSSNFSEGAPFFSPGGKKLFYYSYIPIDNTNAPKKDLDIWFVQREGNSWSNPQNLGPPVNTANDDIAPTVSLNGNLYFHRLIDRNFFIYFSKFLNGKYTNPEKLADFDAAGPCIAPDESYVIFHSDKQSKYNSHNELFISFKKSNGLWTEPKNMGKAINSFPSMSARISPEGKYIFFTSIRKGNLGMYWIDAKIIEELKPKEIK